MAFDQAESDLFRIENELREKYPELELVIALGNIRDTDRLSEVMQRHGVESVFHAAAYKHVPMMESHVLEAVRNNVLGTWNLVRAARSQNVRSLLMISSDKAVNPICVMGATKRVCERIVSARWPGNAQTKCVSVRFGNVLGSNGSVVPVFQAQIAAGGPVKVTHPEARRYFMTISEAVSLVVQASTKSEGSEIFVLDMGEPIRIVDLAENMIRLAGKVPYEDIDIQFTGLRPGEKLIEEIRGKSEGLLATSTREDACDSRTAAGLGPGRRLDRRVEAVSSRPDRRRRSSPTCKSWCRSTARRPAAGARCWSWCRWPSPACRASCVPHQVKQSGLKKAEILCCLAPYSKPISRKETPRAPITRAASWRAFWSCGDAASSRPAARSGTPCPDAF